MHLCLVRQHDGLLSRSHVDRQLGADPFPQQVAGGHHLDHGLPGRNISRFNIYHACKCTLIYLDHGLPGKIYQDYQLGKPSRGKSEVFFNIVQKAFDPPPLLFEHLSYFAGGVF